MKFLCIGDVHIKTTNLDYIDLLQRQVEQMAQEVAPDYIVILGDVLHHHERVHTLALNRAYALVRALGEYAPVYILVGNHDYIQNNQFLTENHWMNGMKQWDRVTVVDRVTFIGDVAALVPYVPPGRFVEALGAAERWSARALIFAHQEFRGAKMRAITSAVGDEWAEDWPQVISGHIHGRQKVGPNILYVGASIPSFTESAPTSVTVCSVGPGRGDLHFAEKPLVFPRHHPIETNIEDIVEVAAQLTPSAMNKYCLILRTSLFNYRAFKMTADYEALVARGFKISFYPRANDKAVAPARAQNFTQLLYANILDKMDPFLYCAATRVLEDRALSEDDVLLIKTSHSLK